MHLRPVAVAALATASLAGCGSDRTPPPAPGGVVSEPDARALLERHRPVYRMDARDPDRPSDVEAFLAQSRLLDARGRVLVDKPTTRDLRAPGTGQVLDAPDDARAGAPTTYGAVRREDGRTWLQYWAFLPTNPQDRGVLRSGRHEGDWEFVQVGLAPDRSPGVVTAAQHKWAEACPWGVVRREGDRPVVFVANGSHASYLAPGEHGRPWPDPDDEARGDGERVDPRLRLLDAQAWRRWDGRWGASRARSWFPIEASSPVGPLRQEDGRDRTPTTFHRDARACGSGAPTLVRDAAASGLGAVLLAAVLLVRRRRAARRGRSRPSAA